MLEFAPVVTLFDKPAHPYTQLLLEAITQLDVLRDQFIEIPGKVPSLANYTIGCRFHPRYPYAD